MANKVSRGALYLFRKYLHKATLASAKVNGARFLTTSQNTKEKPTENSSSTVDKSDVKHFSKLMEDWWNVNGNLKPLHSMNLIRIPFVRDGLVDAGLQKTRLPLKHLKILDVGCGGGILSEGLARIGAEMTGIDASKELIELATQHCHIDPKIADNKPNYLHVTIEDHAKTHPCFYDGVVASEVIEHINNKELFVKSCIDVVKPGGKIFFTTPNRTKLSGFINIFFAENILNAVPKGSHQYEKFITPNELTFLLERNNCHVEVIHGLFYNVICNKWEFVSSQCLLYALEAVKLDDK